MSFPIDYYLTIYGWLHQRTDAFKYFIQIGIPYCRHSAGSADVINSVTLTDSIIHAATEGGSKKMCNWRSSSHIALTPDFIQTYNHINQAYELLKCRLYTFQFLDWLIDFSYLFWLFMFIMLLIVAWITRINAWKHGTFKQALLVHWIG